MSQGTAHLPAGLPPRHLSKEPPESVGVSMRPGAQLSAQTNFGPPVFGRSLQQIVASRSSTGAQPDLPTHLPDRRVVAVTTWMEKNIGANISLGGIAASVNISTSRLRHLFKQETGHPPLHQLKLMRLARARELLQDSFLTLKEVMDLVGIADISHFVKDYKRVHGETPGQTRKAYHLDPSL